MQEKQVKNKFKSRRESSNESSSGSANQDNKAGLHCRNHARRLIIFLLMSLPPIPPWMYSCKVFEAVAKDYEYRKYEYRHACDENICNQLILGQKNSLKILSVKKKHLSSKNEFTSQSVREGDFALEIFNSSPK